MSMSVMLTAYHTVPSREAERTGARRTGCVNVSSCARRSRGDVGQVARGEADEGLAVRVAPAGAGQVPGLGARAVGDRLAAVAAGGGVPVRGGVIVVGRGAPVQRGLQRLPAARRAHVVVTHYGASRAGTTARRAVSMCPS